MVHNVFYCVKSDEKLSRFGHQQKFDCTFSVCPSATVYWGAAGVGGGKGCLDDCIALILVCDCLSILLC